MPKFTKLTIALLTSGFAITGFAHAQDTEWRTETSVDAFAVADADLDGTINRSEFEVYVASRAESGDEHYADIKASGDYDRYFTQKDADADGVLIKDELTPVVEAESEPTIIEDEKMIEE